MNNSRNLERTVYDEKLAFDLYDLSKKIQYQILLKEFQIAKELFEDL